MNETINEYITVLNNLIAVHTGYYAAYKYIQLVRMTNGSNFTQITPEGIVRVEMVLSELTLPVNLHQKRQLGDKLTKINMLDTLRHLTVDFSVLSGMSPDDWSVLIDYLYQSNVRAQSYNNQAWYAQIGQKIITDIIRTYPWTITVLLMELVVLAPVKTIN